jgi:hypothetical protein
MSAIYLRIEAVNIGNLIGDSEDLSTIRGSSLMILQLEAPVFNALTAWRANIECKRITAGASQAIFRVELIENENPEKLADYLARKLRQHSLLKYATIVVDQIRADDPDSKYDSAREKVLAKNRWRQLRQCSVSVAESFSKPGGRTAQTDGTSARAPWCPIDQVRPATELAENVRNEQKRIVSRSVKVRRQFGFDEKQNFYHKYAKWSPARETFDGRVRAAWHFQQIAEFERDGDGKFAGAFRDLPLNLDGKIAVFYADGNQFGSKQLEFSVDEDRQQKWDQRIQATKVAALQDVLRDAWDSAHPEQLGAMWWNRSSNCEWRLRFETLIWGGDELLWVMPAWQGWKVASTFFQVVRAAENMEQSRVSVDVGQLSYSAGLVFCHAEAPIQRIWALAENLAEEAKAAGKGLSSEDAGNLLCYATLESFDQLSPSLKSARSLHLPFPPSQDSAVLQSRLSCLPVHADRLADLQNVIPWMRTHFPRSAMYRLLAILRDEADAGLPTSQFTRWFIRAHREIQDGLKSKMLQPFGYDAVAEQRLLTDGQRMNWLHLADLWDYVV